MSRLATLTPESIGESLLEAPTLEDCTHPPIEAELAHQIRLQGLLPASLAIYESMRARKSRVPSIINEKAQVGVNIGLTTILDTDSPEDSTVLNQLRGDGTIFNRALNRRVRAAAAEGRDLEPLANADELRDLQHAINTRYTLERLNSNFARVITMGLERSLSVIYVLESKN